MLITLLVAIVSRACAVSVPAAASSGVFAERTTTRSLTVSSKKLTVTGRVCKGVYTFHRPFTFVRSRRSLGTAYRASLVGLLLCSSNKL